MKINSLLVTTELCIIVCFIALGLQSCQQKPSRSNNSPTEKAYALPPVTLAQYDQLHLRMTRQEVISIMGSAGQKEEFKGAPATMEMNYWRNPDNSYINVNFEGDKVVSIVQSGFK